MGPYRGLPMHTWAGRQTCIELRVYWVGGTVHQIIKGGLQAVRAASIDHTVGCNCHLRLASGTSCKQVLLHGAALPRRVGRCIPSEVRAAGGTDGRVGGVSARHLVQWLLTGLQES
jgi:hypothetical protein